MKLPMCYVTTHKPAVKFYPVHHIILEIRLAKSSVLGWNDGHLPGSETRPTIALLNGAQIMAKSNYFDNACLESLQAEINMYTKLHPLGGVLLLFYS